MPSQQANAQPGARPSIGYPGPKQQEGSRAGSGSCYLQMGGNAVCKEERSPVETADSQARVDRWARVLRKHAIVMGLILLCLLAVGAAVLLLSPDAMLPGLILVSLEVTAVMLAALVAPFSACLAIGVLLEASRENRRAKRTAWLALLVSLPYLVVAGILAYVYSRF